MSTYIKHLPQADASKLNDQIQFKTNEVNKEILVARKDLMMVLFAVDKDAVIAKHSTTGDALVQILEGVAQITIADKEHIVHGGQFIVLPATIPHELLAIEAFKMLLTIVKPEGK